MLSRFGRWLAGGSCAVLFGPVIASASVLLFEPFNYPNGPLVTASGGVWTTHSGVAGQLEVLAGRADMSAPESEDVNRLLAGQPYPATTNTILYVSFAVNFTTLPSPSGEYFAHFKDAGTSNFRAKIFASTSGAGPGQFRLGLANAANSAATNYPISLNLNTDYQVVIHYAISNATSTLWLNPLSEADPAINAGDPATARAVVAFALRQNSGIGVLTLDDLRVGNSFAEVYSPPPFVAPGITQPPVNTGAIEGGTAVLTVVASGSAPLSYQWSFNGTNLAGATNSTLTLNNVNPSVAGLYGVTVSNPVGATNSGPALLTVIEPNGSGTLSLVHYNVKGNFAADWSTNSPQVLAIARQLQYLNPDLITLNEIPNGLRYEMTNWMIAFFPAYALAISPGTDGAIRSGVISRFPIARSQSWLDGVSLTNFGYNGVFTRDLFEAEIPVPGATEPVHVFTTHLKSGSDADSQSRRAAECSAISNLLVTIFVPSNGYRPYVLTGDLNEDIAISMSQNDQAIQRLIAPLTGLHLTTPLNPFNSSRFTHSIQGSLDARFDYILPAGVLSSNIVLSQVFRTDLLPPPLPLNLNSNDDIVASDHLPVQMIFNYPDPPLRLTLSLSNQTVTLNWFALVGRRFNIEDSEDLASWSVTASNVVALSAQPLWATSANSAVRYYRVVRVP